MTLEREQAVADFLTYAARCLRAANFLRQQKPTPTIRHAIRVLRMNARAARRLAKAIERYR